MVINTTNRRVPDREVKHILSRIFFDDQEAEDAFKAAGIKTRYDLNDAIKDDETLKKMRWKDPDTQLVEMMDQTQMDELKQVPSFLNWLQNTHGTLPDHPVDICHDRIRPMFDMFLNMSPAERQTADANVCFSGKMN